MLADTLESNMKKVFFAAVAAFIAISSFNLFYAEEPVKAYSSSVSQILEKANRKAPMPCVFAEAVYASKEDIWEDNTNAKRGNAAFNRCVWGTMSKEELAKAMELYKAAQKKYPNRYFKIKEFRVHSVKYTVHTTLG